MSALSSYESEKSRETSETILTDRRMTYKAIKYNLTKTINKINGNECEISFQKKSNDTIASIQFECQKMMNAIDINICQGMNDIIEKLKKLKNEHESCLRLKDEEYQNLKTSLVKCDEATSFSDKDRWSGGESREVDGESPAGMHASPVNQMPRDSGQARDLQNIFRYAMHTTAPYCNQQGYNHRYPLSTLQIISLAERIAPGSRMMVFCSVDKPERRYVDIHSNAPQYLLWERDGKHSLGIFDKNTEGFWRVFCFSSYADADLSAQILTFVGFMVHKDADWANNFVFKYLAVSNSINKKIRDCILEPNYHQRDRRRSDIISNMRPLSLGEADSGLAVLAIIQDYNNHRQEYLSIRDNQEATPDSINPLFNEQNAQEKWSTFAEGLLEREGVNLADLRSIKRQRVYGDWKHKNFFFYFLNLIITILDFYVAAFLYIPLLIFILFYFGYLLYLMVCFAIVLNAFIYQLF